MPKMPTFDLQVVYMKGDDADAHRLGRAFRHTGYSVSLSPGEARADGALEILGHMGYGPQLLAITPTILPYASGLIHQVPSLVGILPILLKGSYVPEALLYKRWFDLRQDSPDYRQALDQLVAYLQQGGDLTFPQGRPESVPDYSHLVLPETSLLLTNVDRIKLGGIDIPILTGLGGPDVPPPPSPPEWPATDQHLAPPNAPRFADFTFYEEEPWRQKVPATDALRAGRYYRLEVAVRRDPTGLPAENQERTSIREPKRESPVHVYVTAEGADRFMVYQKNSFLVLPPNGDSVSNAEFRVSPVRASVNAEDLAYLKVSLYYEFNLIEHVLIKAEVVEALAESSAPRFRPTAPVFFRHQIKPSGELDFANIRPRSVNIRIGKSADEYELQFVFKNETGSVLPFTATSQLKAVDLEDRVAAARALWTKLALNTAFTNQIEGPQGAFDSALMEFATLGRDLWHKLFGVDAMATIGDWLTQHPLEKDCIVQICVDEDARDFVFPWALIYDKKLPAHDYEVDPEAFWGVKYRIEQQFRNRRLAPDLPVQVQDRLTIGFMLWAEFVNADEQKALMQSFVHESSGRLEVSTPPITSAQDCYTLLEGPSSNILYFYSHGHTRPRQDTVGKNTDFGQLFSQRYRALPEASPLRVQWRLLYDSIQATTEPALDRSYIQLSFGRLYLDELAEIRAIACHPLVVLNMCESAQISPMLSESFVHFFLDRGAAGVLGTECPMTIQVAHPFARCLMNDVLRGVEVGTALLHAQREFLKKRNPLGLAYTFFGPTTLKFKPPPLKFSRVEDATLASPSSEEEPKNV